MSQIFRLLLLGNGWADCVEIWHVIVVPLVAVHAVVTGIGPGTAGTEGAVAPPTLTKFSGSPLALLP